MKLRTLLLAVAAITSSTLTASGPFVSIFRNDNNFNFIKLSPGARISHSEAGDSWVVNVADKDGTPQCNLPVEVIESVQVRDSDIPTIYFTLTDYPDAENLWDKELYMQTQMRIEGNGYCEDADGLELKIKGRGNSSWLAPKKPIRLKFDKKTQLLDFTKAKSYVLLANYYDETLCRNALALHTASLLDLPYTNTFHPCNVVLNGHELGTYLLTEKIGINKASVDIDEEKGILFEMSNEYDEKYKFHSATYGMPVMVKDPDLDELFENSTEQTPEGWLQLWRADFEEAERGIKAGKADEYFDMDNFVDYYLLYNFCCNDELSHPKSEYIYKTELGRSAKYIHGPVWDFDMAFTVLWELDGDGLPNAHRGIELNALDRALTETESFKTKYRARLQEFIDTVYPGIEKWLEEYATLILPSAKRDGLLWSEKYYTGWCWRVSGFDAEYRVGLLKQYLRERIEFMKDQCGL